MSATARVHSSGELGRIVRGHRRERQITQATLADMANVARSAIQKLEAGRGTVTLDTAIKVLTTLSLDLGVIDRHGVTAKVFQRSIVEPGPPD